MNFICIVNIVLKNGSLFTSNMHLWEQFAFNVPKNCMIIINKLFKKLDKIKIQMIISLFRNLHKLILFLLIIITIQIIINCYNKILMEN